jgi:hypothetical protein
MAKRSIQKTRLNNDQPTRPEPDQAGGKAICRNRNEQQ